MVTADILYFSLCAHRRIDGVDVSRSDHLYVTAPGLSSGFNDGSVFSSRVRRDAFRTSPPSSLPQCPGDRATTGTEPSAMASFSRKPFRDPSWFSGHTHTVIG